MSGISIIIPAYNAEQYILECIQSVIDLELPDYEIIVVDDGSTDKTEKIITENLPHWNEYRQNVIFIKQCNQGVSSARNAAIDCATKRWVTFVDADDLLLPSFAKACDIAECETDTADVLVFSLLQSNSRDLSKCKCYETGKSQRFSPNDRILLMKNTLDFVDESERLEFRLQNSPGKFYDTNLLKYNKLCFPVGVKNGEDLLFNLKVFECSEQVIAFDLPIYLYYTNPTSLTHRFKPDIKEITELFFANLQPIIEQHTNLLPQYYRSLANNFFLDMNQYLFHPYNHLKLSERWEYMSKAITYTYHDGLYYHEQNQKGVNKFCIRCIQHGVIVVPFVWFYSKFLIKRLLKAIGLR